MSATTSERPPVIIIHLIRHASSEKASGAGLDPRLSQRGERQCDGLFEDMRKHACYITHIFSSPMKRCLETAQKGLREATGRGIRIQIMPALAGRNGIPIWALQEGTPENDEFGPWISELPDSRSKAKDADFVRGWLTGKDIPLEEAQKVLEVAIVSQTSLLRNLLGKNSPGFPNAKVYSYTLDEKGKWILFQHQSKIDAKRVIQQDWRRKLEAIVLKKRRQKQENLEKEVKQAKRDEEAAKKIRIEKDLKVEAQKKNLLACQDSMLVVDRESNQIVTFLNYQKLLEARLAKLFEQALISVLWKGDRHVNFFPEARGLRSRGRALLQGFAAEISKEVDVMQTEVEKTLRN